MKIQIDPHTLERAQERGATEAEIIDVIKNGDVLPAKYGRLAKTKVFEFNQMRHDKFYDQKRVEVIYVVEEKVTITVTVYVFYGKWEAADADSI